MDSSVRFANAQYYDADEGLIWFTAFTRHQVIPCAIEQHAMNAFFHCSELAPLAGFSRWRHRIERIAEHVIAQGRVESDGSIRLGLQDCLWLWPEHIDIASPVLASEPT